ncbi:Clavaminate synthase-like protein [Meredithblackwellia eburnea MCA 4105]
MVDGNLPPLKTWDKATLRPALALASYKDYSTSDAALHKLLGSLLQTGIAFVGQVPTAEKKGINTELRKLVERIGSLRKTWYGDLWDVRAEEGSKNIAYTNLDLGLHMDLTHFDHPPRWQFLHSLQNTAIVGGSSYFVDTYHIAQLIKQSHPEAYETLCTAPVTFEYENGGQHTRWIRPTIEVDPLNPEVLLAVNYSPPFQGPFHLPSLSKSATSSPSPMGSSSPNPDGDATSQLLKLHSALALFADLAGSAENQYHVQLEPGDCVIFDNRRVLHARTAFEFVDHQAGGAGSKGKEGEERGRWLKGAYMDGDELSSRWRVLEAKRRRGELV